MEVAEQQTKIRKKYLVALEEENFDIMPGKVYVRGFLRNYARFLGINGEDLVDLYSEHAGLPQESEDLEDLASQTVVSQKVFGRRRYAWVALLGVIVVAGLVAFFSGIIGNANEPEKDISQGVKDKSELNKTYDNELKPDQKPSAPENKNKAGIGSAQFEGIKLVLSFNGRCWMQINVDQEVVFEGFANAGDKKVFAGESSISIHVGDAGVVKANVNGVAKGFLGAKGQPLKKTFRADNEGDT